MFTRKQRLGKKVVVKKPKELHPTGMEKIDSHINQTINEFEDRIKGGEDSLGVIKGMADSKDKISYEKTGLESDRIDIVMNNLSKIMADSNKTDTGLKIKTIDDDRSWFMPLDNEILVGESGEISNNLYHEYAHYIEDNEMRIHRSCVNFLKNRTKDEEPTKLNDLFPNLGYDDNEYVKVDHFIHPYMGHIYESNVATEILSMGLEKFTTNKNIEKFHEEDREHFSLVLTAILGRL